jgi:3-keto-5-aminohexanoate cleavage enzyme
MTTPVVLEVASNGVTTRTQNPAVPREPKELAEDALACLAAGAAIVHTHPHEMALAPAEGAGLYLEAYRPVLAERPDALLYPTVAPGRTIEERYGHTALLAEAGAIRMGALDTGSVNIGGSLPDGWPIPMDYVYTNSPNDIRHMAEVCRTHRLGPSVAVFEPGFLRVVLAAEKKNALPPGTFVKLYFSAGGYLGGGEPTFGAPPIREALDMYLAMLAGSKLPWAVAVIGGSLLDSKIVRPALERGGHLRVGLEDFFTAKSNVDEVRRAKELCREVGRPLASCAEAEAILGLPRRQRAGSA